MFDHQLYLQTNFYFFYLFTIEPVELLVAKSYYSIGLSVAKSWTVKLSVAKDDVRRYLHRNDGFISNCRGPSL